MCNWRKWIWPGILATVLLTALAMLMKSGSIEEDLQAKALNDLSGGHNWAQVELDGRDLKLTGVAPSEEAAAEALQIADDAYDVRIAASDVELLPIADPFKLAAVKADNKLTLDGNIPSEEARVRITDAAKSAYPDAEIIDNLTLSRGAPEGFAALAGFGIGQLTGLTSGTASLENTALSVSGVAPTVEIYEATNAALAGNLPGGGTLASADISGPTVEAYSFAATKSAEGITLEGYVPSNEVRAEVFAAAEAAHAGKPVTDNLKLALGAPDGLSALAGFGIGQLTDLTSGTASLSGTALSVTGVAPTVEIYDAANAALGGSLPAGGTLAHANISGPTVDVYSLSATKSANGVVLEGYVPSNETRGEVVAAAEAASGGKPVTDNLKLALGAPEGLSALAGFGIGQLTDLTSGTASLSGSALSVTGVAPTVEVYKATNSALRGSLPGNGTLAHANISGPTVDNYTLSATKSADGVTLDGFVPSSEVRGEVVAAAEVVSDGKPVTDNLKLALGAPEGFAGLATFGISQLKGMKDGRAGLANSDLSVTGNAKSIADYDAVRMALKNNLPAGGRLTVENVSSPAISPYTFSAVENESGVVLSGFVPDEATRSSLVAEAKKTTDGAVTDRLAIGEGAPAGFAALAGFGVSRLTDFSTGSATLSDTNLSVRGTAHSPQAYDAATAALKGSIPSNGKVVLAAINRSTVRPYTFSATKSENAVVLDGYVGSDAEKAGAVDHAKSLNPGLRVIDRLAVANGAPGGVDWVAANKLAIKEASQLGEGSASLMDNAYSVEGVAKTNKDYDAIKAETAGNLGAGLTLKSENVRRPDIVPYVWSYQKAKDGGSKLSGYVPQSALADNNVKQAQAATSAAVENMLEVGAGAPNGFDAATSVGIRSVNRLVWGQATINGTELVVRGEAASKGVADEIGAQVENSVPPGFTGKHVITFPKVVAPAPKPKLDECQANLTANMKNNSIHFETAKAIIAEKSYDLLDRLAAVVKSCPTATVMIEGHTDADGSEAYNQGLSEERANAVRSFLIDKGVFVGRLKAVGYGETRPIGDNMTKEGKAMNRRIEFTVVK